MPDNRFPADRFDDVPRERSRVGAHRAEHPRMRTGLLVLWAALLAIVLFVAGVLGTLAITNRLGWVAPGTGSASQSPTVAPTVDTSYRVLILNASGDSAHAEAVRAQVIDNGWPEDRIDAADASEADFPNTTVYYVDAADQAAALGLAELLGAEVAQDAAYTQPDESGRSPLTVVIGLDATGTPAS